MTIDSIEMTEAGSQRFFVVPGTGVGDEADRIEIGEHTWDHAAALILFEGYSLKYADDEAQIVLNEEIMSGRRGGTKVFHFSQRDSGGFHGAHSVGETDLVEFEAYKTGRKVNGKAEVRTPSDRVGGWTVRLALPENEDAKYCFIVAGLHVETTLVMDTARNAYGQQICDPMSGMPIRRPRLYRGWPLRVRSYSPIMRRRMPMSSLAELEAAQDLTEEIGAALVNEWETRSAGSDGLAEEARIARAADAAMLTSDARDDDESDPYAGLD